MKEFLSPAKINIGLHIISKREDGYHNIETIFYPIKIFDKLIFSMSEDFFIDCNDKTIPTDERNLIYKSRNILCELTGKKLNVKIRLEKNIPTFAGLGGGSSNAAITLIALNDLFELNLSNMDLFDIANKIGSDVPFFLLNQPAYAEGRGEILTPIKDFHLDYKILLISPGIKISTSWAYSKFKESGKKIDLKKINTIEDFLKFKNLIINDFESIVFPIQPEIEFIKKTLIEAGAIYSQMSGSGSSVYGLFEKDFEFKEVKKLFKRYRIFEC